MLLRRAQNLSQRAPTALQGPSHPQELRAVPSATLDMWRPHWARPPATSASPASMQRPPVLFPAKVAPWERLAYLAASRTRIAIWPSVEPALTL